MNWFAFHSMRSSFLGRISLIFIFVCIEFANWIYSDFFLLSNVWKMTLNLKFSIFFVRKKKEKCNKGNNNLLYTNTNNLQYRSWTLLWVTYKTINNLLSHLSHSIDLMNVLLVIPQISGSNNIVYTDRIQQEILFVLSSQNK